jgi:hypothetical protein
MKRTAFLVLILGLIAAPAAVAQSDAPKADEQVASCNMDNGDQIAVRYVSEAASGERSVFGGKVPYGTVWTPQNKPMILFATGAFSVGSQNLSPGAYTMFLIPNKTEWTLVVSKETDVNAKYDSTKDAARTTLEIGSLPNAQNNFRVFLGHVGPNQCSISIHWQKRGGFANFGGKL